MKIPRIAWAAYGFALFVIVMDQLTKAWVLGSADVSDPAMIPSGYLFAEVIPGILNLTMVRNTGVSFGLFGGGEARWALSVFSIVVAGALAWWALKAERRTLVSAIGLVIGGAIGNAIDRIQYGYVVDFIDFSGTGVFPWVFNIADSAITIGVLLLIIDSVMSERKQAVGVAHEKA
ncbi:signal peptidase II [Brevundimonas sp. TWP2-3-2]|uniref:signal peptidase II n=1 Tax=unclassified Brevundimonas TaxID=2622653 RepID=UPI003CF6CDBE